MRCAFPMLLLTLTGCLFGGDPKINGVWSGSTTRRIEGTPDRSVSFSMSVRENDDKRVTGLGTTDIYGVGCDGSSCFPVGSTDFTVTGTHVHPSVALTLSRRFESWSFNGSFETDDLITGLLNGSGLNNEQISFLRSGS